VILERRLKCGGHTHDRAIPEHGGGVLPPLGVGWIQNGIVPVKSKVNATVRLRLRGVFKDDLAKLFRDKMLRVPKLTGALVGDSDKRAVNRRTQVRGKHGLPYNQHPERRVGIAVQKLFDCGGPPQTS